MKKTVNKIIADPAFYGGLLGAITGVYIGTIIAGETGKPFKRLIAEGACAGMITGSCYACIDDLNNTRKIIRFLKMYKNDELVENLFA